MSIKLKRTNPITNVVEWRNLSSLKLRVSDQWRNVTKALLKVGAEWKIIFGSSGPKIDFPLEISASSTSWPSTLTGRNYHWENADTLSFKFQSSLTNTTDSSAWTDLTSFETITNPPVGSSNTKTFLVTSANFSTTVRSKFFRFVVKAVDTANNLTVTEFSNNINISKSALVGTPGTAVIARDSTTSYVYRVTNNGTWSSTPVSYSYQWQQLLNGTWTDISGATEISNNMNSFVGKDVRCKVFAVDDLGATSQLPIISNDLFVDFAPPSVASFTATGGISKITYSYVVTSDNQFPTIKLKIERLQSGGSYLQTNLVDLTSKTGTNVVQSISQSGTYRATLTASDGINPDSFIVVDNLVVANLNRTNVAIAQTTTNLSGATNITFSKTGTGSGQTAVIGWTNGSGVQTTDVYWSGNYNGNDSNKPVSGTTQSSSFLMSAATGSANITADVVQKAQPQFTISWNQTNAQSYRVTYRLTPTGGAGSFDTVVTGNSSASSVSLVLNAASATVRVLEVVVYEYINQNAGQPTGSVVGSFTITPEVQVTLGATQDFTTSASGTVTYVYPTISGISISNTTPFPGSATSISVSNTPPSNTGSVSWANGSNTSVANLRSVTGSGSLATQSDPTSLLTTGNFTVISTGTALSTIRAINTNKTVHATWTQANSQSYRILYSVSGVQGNPFTLNGNSSEANPVVRIGTSANTFTLSSITVYPELNQGGSGVTLSSTASATGANTVTDSAGSGSVIFTAPAVAPSGGTATVDPTTGTAGSTTFTVSTSGWSGTAPITFAYSWQYMNNNFQYIAVATGTTFAPTTAQNSIAFDWRVVVTATNSAGSATASASFTVNNPVFAPANTSIPTLSPTSIAVGTILTAGVGTWSNSPTSYDIRIYRGTAGVIMSETLVASGTSTSLTYTVTQADFDSGQRYFRTYVNATNSGGSSGFVAGQERGPIDAPVQYTVTWDALGGSNGTQTTGPFNAGVSHTAPSPGTRSGFTFVHWRFPASGGTDPVFRTVGQTYTPTTSGVTFGAIWSANLPTNPTTFTASTDRSTDVRLAWSGQTNAVSFEIYWNQLTGSRPASTVTPDFPAAPNFTPITASPFDDTTIPVGSSRQYWIRVRNTQGVTEWFPLASGASGRVGTRISAPPFFPPFFPFFPPFFPPFFGAVTPTISNLSVSGTGRLSRVLSWTSTNQASYSIATSPTTNLNGATGFAITSRSFSGLAAGTTYAVTVTVFATGGGSATASTSFST